MKPLRFFRKFVLCAGFVALCWQRLSPLQAQGLLLAPDSDRGRAPESWYLSPAQRVQGSEGKRELLEAPSSEFVSRVAELFNAKGAAFDRLVSEPPANANLDLSEADWELSLIKGELALNSQGQLGYLALAGTTAVESHWYRKSAQGQKFFDEMAGEFPYEEAEARGLVFSAASRTEDLEEQLRLLGERLSRAGKSAAVPKVLASVRQRLELLQRWSQALADTRAWGWVPVALHVDLIFDAEGQVRPEVSAGGGLQLSLHWFLPAGSELRAHSLARPSNAKKDSDFAALVTGLSSELTAAFSAEEPLSQPRGLDLALGLGAGGRVGLVTGKGEVLAQLAFKPRYLQAHRLPLRARTLEKQRSHASKPLLFLGEGSTLSSIEPKIFRESLRRAQAMGRFFLGVAKKKQFKHWQFKALQTSYTLGLNGAVGLATLQGAVSVRYLYLER